MCIVGHPSVPLKIFLFCQEEIHILHKSQVNRVNFMFWSTDISVLRTSSITKYSFFIQYSETPVKPCIAGVCHITDQSKKNRSGNFIETNKIAWIGRGDRTACPNWPFIDPNCRACLQLMATAPQPDQPVTHHLSSKSWASPQHSFCSFCRD